MEMELKPCPFCGGKARLYNVDGSELWFVGCTGCFIITNRASKSLAAALWNRREPMTSWISVKDRLPEKLEPVNVVWVNRGPEPYYSDIKDKPYVGTAYYCNGKWWWYSCVCEDYLREYGYSNIDEVDSGIEITHWMPLPELPEDET